MRLRLASAADEAQVRSCAEVAYARYVSAIGRRPAPMDTDYAAAIAAGQVHVAEVDGEVAGYVQVIPGKDDLHLEAVAVRPEFAGRGLGRTLVWLAEAEARRLGLPWVRLYTNAKMAENLAIYPHLGYIETGRRAEHGFDRVFFEKRLTDSA